MTDDIRTGAEVGRLHDAGGGDVEGEDVESQQHAEVQQHDDHLEY